MAAMSCRTIGLSHFYRFAPIKGAESGKVLLSLLIMINRPKLCVQILIPNSEL